MPRSLPSSEPPQVCWSPSARWRGTHASPEERRLAARERLDAYRAPLLSAVDDLGRRINNVRNDSFLAYSEVESRRELAKVSFAFRVAQYFGWVEIIYGYADRLRFENDETTKKVAATIGDIGWIFSFDEYDRVDQDDFTSSQLMLWREQQRAVGELMVRDGEKEAGLGFASFAVNYDRLFRRWLDDFAAQAMNPGAATSSDWRTCSALWSSSSSSSTSTRCWLR